VVVITADGRFSKDTNKQNLVLIKNIRIMKKTFKQCTDQLERIYRLYLHGFGTKNLLAKAERFMCETTNVGLCF
jgi:hypothetical protein